MATKEELNPNLENRKVIIGWSKIYLQKLNKSIREQKIGVTGSLARSIRRQLVFSDNEITEVYVRFHMYGRFVDMGVGRGVKAYERGSNKDNRIGAKRYGARVNYVNRKPKRWFNKRSQAEIWKLRELLARSIAHAHVHNINSSIGDYTEYSVRL